MVIFDPETGEVIEEGEELPDTEEIRTIGTSVDDDECDPEIEDCFGLLTEEEEPSEYYPYELDAILLGSLAEVEVFLPMIIWFTLAKPVICDGCSVDNVAYRRAWHGIWLGSILSYGM